MNDDDLTPRESEPDEEPGALAAEGLLLVCGTDEAGRGAVAERLKAEGAGEVLELARPSSDPEALLRAGADSRVALVVVDVAEGLDADARRLAHLIALLRIRPVVLVANRVDAGSAEGGERIAALNEEWSELAERIGLPETACLALAALPEYLEGLAVRDGERPAPTEHADQIQATIVWGDEEPLLRGRSYGLRIGERELSATVAPIKYRINLDSFVQSAASKLEAGEIGVAALELSEPIDFAPYAENPSAGSFVLTDPLGGETVGSGLIQFALRRAHNIRWQPLTVDRAAREAALGQRPRVIWLTGLSGAGKSTIANLVEAELLQRGRHTYLLDGDNVRHGLNRDLGFTDADRVENIRRVAEVARLMLDAGLIVIVSFISPFRSERQMARGLFEPGEFLEVHVDTPLAVAEERDPKGLYAKARRGELRNFTGIDSPYEPPEDPELRVDTTDLSPAEAAEQVTALLERG